jgi:NAD dependent epimerase/dehydratase family enzyme
MRAPRVASDALLGKEGTDQLALADQFVSNEKLVKSGYVFFDDQLSGALKHALG